MPLTTLLPLFSGGSKFTGKIKRTTQDGVPLCQAQTQVGLLAEAGLNQTLEFQMRFTQYICRCPDPKARMKIELGNPPSNEKPEVTVKSMYKAAHRGQAECEGQQQVQGRPPAHRAQAQYAAKVA